MADFVDPAIAKRVTNVMHYGGAVMQLPFSFTVMCKHGLV